MESTTIVPTPTSLSEVPDKSKLVIFFSIGTLFYLSVVVILLRATANAPILKQKKFKVSSSQQFLAIQEFVRKQLLLQETDPLVPDICDSYNNLTRAFLVLVC